MSVCLPPGGEAMRWGASVFSASSGKAVCPNAAWRECQMTACRRGAGPSAVPQVRLGTRRLSCLRYALEPGAFESALPSRQKVGLLPSPEGVPKGAAMPALDHIIPRELGFCPAAGLIKYDPQQPRATRHAAAVAVVLIMATPTILGGCPGQQGKNRLS
jgi:hypothetical protein